MEDFVFNPKTKIIFGKSKEVDVGDVLSSYGSKKVLFIYGSQSIYNNGLYNINELWSNGDMSVLFHI